MKKVLTILTILMLVPVAWCIDDVYYWRGSAPQQENNVQSTQRVQNTSSTQSVQNTRNTQNARNTQQVYFESNAKQNPDTVRMIIRR